MTGPWCSSRGCGRLRAPDTDVCWKHLYEPAPRKWWQRLWRNDSNKGHRADRNCAGAVVPVPGTRAVGRDGASPKDPT